MFHISEDKRAQESAQKCCEALSSLLCKNSFERITVSQICAEAAVSRPTFYRLFDTPGDIIYWYCDRSTKEMCRTLDKQDIAVQEQPFRFIVQDITAHPEALELAYRAGRVDMADAAFYSNIMPFLSALRRKHNMSEADVKLGIVLMSAIITSSYRIWLQEGKYEAVDAFYKRVHRLILSLQ